MQAPVNPAFFLLFFSEYMLSIRLNFICQIPDQVAIRNQYYRLICEKLFFGTNVICGCFFDAEVVSAAHDK